MSSYDYDYLPDEFIECRTLIHAWEEIPYDGQGPRHWNITRSTVPILFRCLRCGTLRYEFWSSITGDLLHRVYRTPEGYSLPKGKGRRVLMRKEYLERRHPVKVRKGRAA